jgi:hypothetical protein
MEGDMGRLWELVEDLDTKRAAVPTPAPMVDVQPVQQDHLADLLTFFDAECKATLDTPAEPGTKRLGAFTPCLWCGVGTWVRYGGLPTCLPCARSWPASRTPGKDKAHLWRLLDIWAGMDEATWQGAAVKALYEDIMDVFEGHAKDADRWFREWREAHPEARLA